MTARPVTIDRGATLAAARRVMHAHEIRHLPVLEDGRLVGILSDRELQVLEATENVDRDRVCVGEAMMPNPYICTSDTSLDEVTEIMAAKKYGSVVIMGHDGVEGIFTAVDACQALMSILRRAVAETP